MYVQPILELQVSASAFLATQLLGLQTQKLTFPPPISIGSIKVVVDHVEFGANSLRHSEPREEFVSYKASTSNVFDRVNGKQVQIAQPLTVFLADLADILSHPNQPPASLFPVQATIVINLDYGVGAIVRQDRLQFSVLRTEIGPLPPLLPGVDVAALKQQFQALAAGMAPARPLTFGLAGNVLGLGPNVGMSVDSTLTRLAFRLESGDGNPQDVDIWRRFYQGEIPDRLNGADWGIFQSSTVLDIATQIDIEQGLQEKPDPRFQLVSGVGSVYSNGGGTARITSQFSGNVDAGICTVWTDITVASVLSVGAPNALTIDSELSWVTQTSACTVTAAILGGIVGLAADFVAPVASLIVEPIVGALSGIAAVVYLDSTLVPPVHPEQNCVKTSDTHLTCTKKLPLASTPLGTLSFTTLVALDDGVSVQGQLKAIPVGAPRLVIAIDRPFEWSSNLIASCGAGNEQAIKDFQKNPEGFLNLGGSVSITREGRAPVYLLGVQVIDDTLKVFSGGVTTLGQGTPVEISISIKYPGAQYYRNPYPCQLLVSTTGGTRLVSLGPAPVLTPEIISRLEAQITRQSGDCHKLLDDWFSSHRTYNPVWGVDPVPGETVDHSYEVEIEGLRDDEIATLVDARGEALQIGVAQAGRSLKLSAITVPANRNEIGLIRGGGHVGARAAAVVEATVAALMPGSALTPRRGIRVTERLVVRTATITLPDRCQRLAAGYYGSVPCAFAVLEDRVLAFDLSNPSLPTASFSWSIPGVRGVLTYGAALLAFGREGLVSLGSPSTSVESCGCGARSPVYDAELGSGVIYSLSDQGLDVFSARLHRLATFDVEPSHSLARVGNKLVVGGAKGLRLFELSNPTQPRAIEFYCTTGVADLVIPPVGDGNCVLGIVNPGPSQLLDVRGSEPTVVATFPQLPWYVNTAQLKDLLLTLVPERTAIYVSFFGRSAEM